MEMEHKHALSQLRQQLITEGIRRASGLDGTSVNLKQVAAAVGVPLNDAQDVFPTEEHFREELLAQCTQRLNSHLPSSIDTADFEQAATQFADGYLSFASTSPLHFTAYNSLARTRTFPTDFEDDLDVLPIDPVFARLLEVTRKYMRELGSPQSPWLWSIVTVVLYSGIHGITHLHCQGATRRLSKSGRKILFNAVINHVIHACRIVLPEGNVFKLAPHTYRCDLLPPTEFDVDKASALREQLFEGAIRVVHQEGINLLTVERAAASANIPLHTARQLLTPDQSFQHQLCDHLGATMKMHLMAQFGQLPNTPHPFELSKAIGAAYIGLAVSFPKHFDVYTLIYEQSIMPDSSPDVPMGKAMQFLFDTTRQVLEVAGTPPSTIQIFEASLNLWATAHGLATLQSSGPFSHLSAELRTTLISALLDISGTSLITRLRLVSPEEAKSQMVRIEQH